MKVVDAISSGQVIPLYNKEILNEYEEVLFRPKFSFSKEKIQIVLKMIRQFSLEVNPSPTGEILKDTDDLVFYEVIMEKSDDAYLITGNIKHFPNKEFIVTPQEIMSIINSNKTNKNYSKEP